MIVWCSNGAAERERKESLQQDHLDSDIHRDSEVEADGFARLLQSCGGLLGYGHWIRHSEGSLHRHPSFPRGRPS